MDPRSDVDVQLGIAKCQDHTDAFPATEVIARQYGQHPVLFARIPTLSCAEIQRLWRAGNHPVDVAWQAEQERAA